MQRVVQFHLLLWIMGQTKPVLSAFRVTLLWGFSHVATYASALHVQNQLLRHRRIIAPYVDRMLLVLFE